MRTCDGVMGLGRLLLAALVLGRGLDEPLVALLAGELAELAVPRLVVILLRLAYLQRLDTRPWQPAVVPARLKAVFLLTVHLGCY